MTVKDERNDADRDEQPCPVCPGTLLLSRDGTTWGCGTCMREFEPGEVSA